MLAWKSGEMNAPFSLCHCVASSLLVAAEILPTNRPSISGPLSRSGKIIWHTFPSASALCWYEKRISTSGSNRLRLWENRCESVQCVNSAMRQQVARSSILAQNDNFPTLVRFPSPAPIFKNSNEIQACRCSKVAVCRNFNGAPGCTLTPRRFAFTSAFAIGTEVND